MGPTFQSFIVSVNGRSHAPDVAIVDPLCLANIAACKIIDVGVADRHSTGDASRLPDLRCGAISLVDT
jgi:hypothetical protein